ncbi:MAG: DUF547 domain-containing protein [Saprospiraceae bacterium]
MNQLKPLGLFLMFSFVIACQSAAPDTQMAQDQTIASNLTLEDTLMPSDINETPTAANAEVIQTAKKINQRKGEPHEVKTLPDAETAKAIPVKNTAIPVAITKTTASEAAAIVPEKEQEIANPPSPTEKEAPQPAQEKPAPGLSHDSWDQLLSQFVSNTGKVNYKGLIAQKKELTAYLNLLAQHPVKPDWPKNEKIAYWINAYNAFTVKLILDNYPLASIIDLEGGKVWDKKWIKLGDQTYSLNNIENDILRPQFKDARIHFAVNCAAKSCPPLLNHAWTAANLDTYFNQRAKQFINNPAYNQISANKIVISKIFEWYASDFGQLIDFLNQYTSTTIQPKAKISYLEYDWALNE